MKTRIIMLIVYFFIVGSSVSWAQIGQSRPSIGSTNPSIEGVVVDENGAAIVSARVMLTLVSAGTGQTVFSDDDGRFFAYELQPRIYNVTVSAAGFAGATQSVNLETGSQIIRIVLRRTGGSANEKPTGAVPATDLAVPAKARKHYEEGLKDLNRKKFDKSAEHFKKAIEEYPTYAAAHSALGITYVQLRESERAREAFAKALELDDKSAEAQLGLGLLCNDEKRYADAEQHLLQAQKLNPTDWHISYELGRAYYGLNQLGKAEVHLQRARQEHPDYGNLYLMLANVLVLQNKLAEGLAEMEEFLKVAPDNTLAPKVREKIKLLKAELKKS